MCAEASHGRGVEKTSVLPFSMPQAKSLWTCHTCLHRRSTLACSVASSQAASTTLFRLCQNQRVQWLLHGCVQFGRVCPRYPCVWGLLPGAEKPDSGHCVVIVHDLLLPSTTSRTTFFWAPLALQSMPLHVQIMQISSSLATMSGKTTNRFKGRLSQLSLSFIWYAFAALLSWAMATRPLDGLAAAVLFLSRVTYWLSCRGLQRTLQCFWVALISATVHVQLLEGGSTRPCAPFAKILSVSSPCFTTALTLLVQPWQALCRQCAKICCAVRGAVGERYTRLGLSLPLTALQRFTNLQIYRSPDVFHVLFQGAWTLMNSSSLTPSFCFADAGVSASSSCKLEDLLGGETFCGAASHLPWWGPLLSCCVLGKTFSGSGPAAAWACFSCSLCFMGAGWCSPKHVKDAPRLLEAVACKTCGGSRNPAWWEWATLVPNTQHSTAIAHV